MTNINFEQHFLKAFETLNKMAEEQGKEMFKFTEENFNDSLNELFKRMGKAKPKNIITPENERNRKKTRYARSLVFIVDVFSPLFCMLVIKFFISASAINTIGLISIFRLSR